MLGDSRWNSAIAKSQRHWVPLVKSQASVSEAIAFTQLKSRKIGLHKKK